MTPATAGVCPFTGSLALLAAAPVFYMSAYKLAGMLVLVLPWLYIAPWVHQDSVHVRAPKGMWGALILGAGSIGFLFWLLLPVYFAGLALYVILVVSVLAAYVVYRNGRVEDDQKLSLVQLFKGGPKAHKVAVMTKVKVYGPNNKMIPPPGEEAEKAEAMAYNLTQTLLYDILWNRASEADLSPTGQQTRVRFVIDGVTTQRQAMTLGESETITQYLKTIGGMNVEERRRPQQGKIMVDLVGSPTDMQLNVAGTTNGQRLRFRIVQEFIQTNLDDLGISEDMLTRMREITSKKGLFIVSGRHGSGVTSTLYSLLRQHDAFIRQLVTLESKIAVDMENITQNAYEDPAKLPEMLASALRRDPDIVMVDRCRDQESTLRLCQAASGKSIMIGEQAPDSFTALARWVKTCGDREAAMANLKGVLCQMLVRKLCHTCREAYKPDPALLAKANISGARNVDVFFRPPTQPLTDNKGRPYTCHVCQGSGYVGRTAAFELLEITEDLKKLIVEGGSLSQIKQAARKRKMLYLQEQALKKVIAGETSIQEVIRVSQPPKKK